MSTPKGTGNKDLDNVLQLQGLINDCLRQLKKLEAALAENRRRADALRAGLPALDQLGRQRQYLAAGVSLGTATKTDLDDLDEQVREAQHQHESAEAQLTQLADLASGIEQHCSEWRDRLDGVKQKHAIAVRHYLESEIAARGGEYAQLARQTANAYARLVGLIQAFGPVAFPDKSMPPRGGELLLPGFELDSVKAVMPAQMNGRLFPVAVSGGQHAWFGWSVQAREAVALTGLRLPAELG